MPRPQLHPTDEQRKMVKSLAAFGLTQYQVAGIIGIRSPKTLRKYFRAELDLGDLEGYAKVQQTHFQMATASTGLRPKAGKIPITDGTGRPHSL